MNATIRPPRTLAPLLALLALALTLGLPTQAQAQHLRRKCFMGTIPAPIPDSLARLTAQNTGVCASKVLPGGTMQAIGGQQGDIITAFNGTAVNSWEMLRPMLGRTFEGDPVTVDVVRMQGRKVKKVQLKGTIVGAPREQSTSRYEVAYGEAPWEGGYLRTITMTPKTPGPHPVIYFIPGYNCFSIDNMPRTDAYPQLFDSLAALGYIIYRVDKPGMGDGPSPCHCMETGFDKELSAFAAGYDHLLKQPWASEDRVFLVGHSMGGVQAPLLATAGGRKPRGIAVYGTVFQSWYEYIIAMLRFQNPRNGLSYPTFEQDMAEYVKLFYAHYVEMKPLEEIVKNARWAELLTRDFLMDQQGNLLFRRAFYWQEIATHTLGDAWARTNAHVLSMYGEADFEVFDDFNMSEIARIVNASHPGHGSYVLLKGTNHGMISVGSMDEGIAKAAQPDFRAYAATHFNYQIVTELHSWIQRVLAQG